MKKILFPTDFSEAADNAQNIAIRLAAQAGAELHFLHSLNTAQQFVDMSLTATGDPTMPGMEPEYIMKAMEEQQQKAEKMLKDRIEEAKKQGITCFHHIINNKLDEEVNDFCKEHDIDFIVMGTRGASGFRETFIGSNAQRVVRKARVPVLTVNKAVHDFHLEKMVYASDYLEEDINRQIPRVKEFAKMFNAKIHLLYVNTLAYFEETVDTLKRLKKIQEEYGLEDAETYIYNDYEIDQGILHYAKMIDADLIAIVTHGFSGLRKIVSDNVSESVVNHSDLPVLTLHIRK